MTDSNTKPAAPDATAKTTIAEAPTPKVDPNMMPVGRYLARAVLAECEFKVTEGKDGKQTVLDLPFDVTHPGTKKVHRMTKRLFFSEKTKLRSLQSLKYMGWRSATLKALHAAKFADLTEEVELDVQHREYPEGSGVFRAQIEWINYPGGFAEPATDTDLDILDGKLGDIAAQLSSKGKLPSANGSGGRKASAETTATDDDIPF